FTQNDKIVSLLAAMRDRYACKKFQEGREIPPEQLSMILEAGRLAPSSFGLEHWHFFVSRTRATCAALYKACFSQENVKTASAIITVAVPTRQYYHPDSDFVRFRSERFPGGYQVFVDDYRPYWEYLERQGIVEEWARAQGYIAAAHMMIAAAGAGIDSCPIEGFQEPAVLAILGLNPRDWRISLVLPLGYRDEPVREKIRLSLDELVTESEI
ncbi:MAG: nitroreductase family protein, partial [Termitinemataceae bacterium]